MDGDKQNILEFRGYILKRVKSGLDENQITDLRHFTNFDETDQIYAADSSFIKSGVRDWNSSLAKTIDDVDTWAERGFP